jgi:hypothetical protein
VFRSADRPNSFGIRTTLHAPVDRLERRDRFHVAGPMNNSCGMSRPGRHPDSLWNRDWVLSTFGSALYDYTLIGEGATQ